MRLVYGVVSVIICGGVIFVCNLGYFGKDIDVIGVLGMVLVLEGFEVMEGWGRVWIEGWCLCFGFSIFKGFCF